MILLSFFSLYNMQITNFKINSTRTAINLTIIDALNVSTLKLWTDKTYKDYNLAIDLTSKLSGIATENITITLSDLSTAYFDGVYFIEAEDNTTTSQAIDSDLTRYKECILNKLVEYSICDDCLKNNSISLINAQSLLIGVENAVEQGFINETFNLINSLNKYCSNDCNSCGKYSNITNNNYYSIPQESFGIEPNIQKFELEAGDASTNGRTLTVYQYDLPIYTKTYSENDPSEIIEIDMSKPFRIVLENMSPNEYDIYLEKPLFEDSISLNNHFEILLTEAVLTGVVNGPSGFPLINIILFS